MDNDSKPHSREVTFHVDRTLPETLFMVTMVSGFFLLLPTLAIVGSIAAIVNGKHDGLYVAVIFIALGAIIVGARLVLECLNAPISHTVKFEAGRWVVATRRAFPWRKPGIEVTQSETPPCVILQRRGKGSVWFDITVAGIAVTRRDGEIAAELIRRQLTELSEPAVA